MKATNIGKTIIVWNNLSDLEVNELVNVIKNIIEICRCNKNFEIIQSPIPITLPNNSYLCVVKKHHEVLVNITIHKNEKIKYMPILNGDELYKYISILKNCNVILNNRINMIANIKDAEHNKWLHLPYNKAFENYILSPNINPQDFIKHLKAGTLSSFQKQFLTEVGISLKTSNFTTELQNSINEANKLFSEYER